MFSTDSLLLNTYRPYFNLTIPIVITSEELCMATSICHNCDLKQAKRFSPFQPEAVEHTS
jgi:hypothetical protein